MEHPMIDQINFAGYPKEMQGLQNVIAQPEHAGIDFYGTEILEGDEIVIDAANFQEIILKEHLKRYLEEKVRFHFFVIKGMEVALDAENEKAFAEEDLEKYLHEVHGFKFMIAN